MKYLKEALLDPEKFSAYKVPNRMLLYGQPGTGKTMIAKALAEEVNCGFFEIHVKALKRSLDAGSVIQRCFELAQRQGQEQLSLLMKLMLLHHLTHLAVRPFKRVWKVQLIVAVLSFLLVPIIHGTSHLPYSVALLPHQFLYQILLSEKQFWSFISLKIFLRNREVDDDYISDLAARSIGLAPRALKQIVEGASMRAGRRYSSGESGEVFQCDLNEAFKHIESIQRVKWKKMLIRLLPVCRCFHTSNKLDLVLNQNKTLQ